MFRKWKAGMQNFKIENKINIVFMPLVLLPIIVIIFFVYYMYYETNLSHAKRSMQNNSALVSEQILSKLSSVENCADTLNQNLNYILDILRYEASAGIRDLKFKQSAESQMGIALTMFQEVESISFISPDDECISVGTEGRVSLSYRELTDKYFAGNVYKTWLDLSEKDLPGTGDRAFYLLSTVINIENQEPVGILVLAMREEELSAIYGGIYHNHAVSMHILDADGRVISSMDKEKILQKGHYRIQPPHFYIEKDKLLLSYPIAQADWYIVSEMDLSYVRADSMEFLRYMLPVSIVLGLLVLVTAKKLSRLITKPLLELKNNMVSITYGKLDSYADIYSRDEVGVLSRVYNEMLEKIHSLLQQVEEEQNKKREYELALMQAQIKPHFLYNTLDLVYVLISLGRADEAKSTTKALAHFFRSTLSSGREIIAIEEEISILSDYLRIQKCRYPEVFEYEIQADEEVKAYLIPKLSLQPLAENAIYHGLKQQEKKGFIKILAKNDEESIYLSVQDNGIGIERELLDRILDEAKENRSYKSFGIYNVNRRFKLYYGERYKMEIRSAFPEGTQIDIWIKK